MVKILEPTRRESRRRGGVTLSRLRQVMVVAGLLVAGAPLGFAGPPLDGITFATRPGQVYLPVREVGRGLGWAVREDEKRQLIRLNRHPLPYGSLRRLVDGTWLVGIDDLVMAGATVREEAGEKVIEYRGGKRKIEIRVGPKKAEVDLPTQRLQAWQGARQVLSCRVSSGKRGRTPAGKFTAGPYKARMHYSSRYENAPMPWSVQINGHIFIHGFSSVPAYPASHGCIRVPLDEGNPARFFYEWIDVGTPVRVKAKS